MSLWFIINDEGLKAMKACTGPEMPFRISRLCEPGVARGVGQQWKHALVFFANSQI